MRMGLEGAETNKAQVSAASLQNEMQQSKANYLRSALAGALQDPGSSLDDATKAVALAAKSIGDPETNRIAAAMTAALPKSTGNPESDRLARDATLRTVNGALMSADARGALQVPQSFTVPTGAQTGYGARVDPLTQKIISGPQGWVQQQAGPAEQAARVAGPPGPDNAPTTVPAVSAPGVSPGLVGVPSVTGALAGAPPIGSLGQAPGGATPTSATSDLVDHIISHENTIYGMTAKDPNSSAAGAAGIINSTWKQELAKVHPEMVAGKSDAQIYAMRTDPANLQLTKDVVAQYMQTNATDLVDRGIPVRADTLYLAHGFGAAGASALLKAPGYEPASQVLSADAMKANPRLAGMTVSDVLTQAAQNAGGRQPIMLGAAKPTVPAAPAAAPSPVVPGAMPVGPGLSVPANVDYNVESQKQLVTLNTQARDIAFMQDALKQAMTGRGTEGLQTLKATANSFFPGAFTESTSAYDIVQKMASQLSLQLAGPRASEFKTELAEVGTPGTGMTKEASMEILNKALGYTRQEMAATRSVTDPAQALAQHNAYLAGTDYRAFSADRLSADQHAKLTKQLQTEGKSSQQKFNESLVKADAGGYLGR